MQTILLTGVNGFIGQYLSELLVEDYKVIATGRGSSRLSFSAPNLIYQSLDFTNEIEVTSLFEQYQPEIVIHSGAMSKPDDCETDRVAAYNTNVKGTQHLLKDAARFKSFFIFISTDFVFDGKRGMYSEMDTPENPVNYYGETKLLAEEAVKKYPYDWSIVRPVFVYGHPRQGRQNLLTLVATALQEGKALKIFNDQFRTPTYVEDLTVAIKSIADQKATGIFHISGKDILTPYEMAIAVARILNLDENLIEPVTENTFSQPALRPLKTGFNISKAQEQLGYTPISFEEGLKRTFKL